MAQERPHVFVPRRSALLRAGGTWSLWTLSRSVKSLRVEKSAGPARPSTSQERVLSAHPRLSWVAVRPSSAQLELGFAIVTRPVVVPDVLWTPALPGVFFFFYLPQWEPEEATGMPSVSFGLSLMKSRRS